MKFLDRLAARWLARRDRQRMETKIMPFTLPTWNRGLEIQPLVNYQSYVNEGYQRNSVVYSCIRKIATTAPAAYLCVEREVNGQREKVSDHPLLATFQNPNPFTAAFTLQEIIHTFLNIIGECYLIKVGFGGRIGRPPRQPELYLVRPDLMFPVPGTKKLLGFVYRGINGERTPFMPDEVIHVKYPNPSDIYEGLGRGLSPLSAAALETDIDNQSTAFIKDFFGNAAVPFGLLKSKQILDEDEILRIRARLREQYSGERKWHETMILDADAEYQKMGMDFDQMALPELRGLTESRICAVFDVPAILVGVQVGLEHEAGFTTAWPEARKALWMDKIIPDNRRIAEILTMSLAEQLEENEFVAHDYRSVEVLQENRTQSFQRANQAWLGDWRTMNETRREVGDPPRPDGDVLYSQYKRQFAPQNLPATTQPVGEA